MRERGREREREKEGEIERDFLLFIVASIFRTTGVRLSCYTME